MKRWIGGACALLLMICAAGCGGKKPAEPASKAVETEIQTEVQTEAASEAAACELEDGIYTAKFDTDSSMFRVNETCEGLGTLTVEGGKMTIHVSLASVHIVNLYPGTADEAKADEAGWLQPSTDTVTYKDGTSEEVFGFDVPVPALGTEFDVAILGTKGKWYDHKVSVSDPQPAE